MWYNALYFTDYFIALILTASYKYLAVYYSAGHFFLSICSFIPTVLSYVLNSWNNARNSTIVNTQLHVFLPCILHCTKLPFAIMDHRDSEGSSVVGGRQKDFGQNNLTDGQSPHPMHEDVTELQSLFGDGMLHPKSMKKAFHRSFLPAAVRLYNQNCSHQTQSCLDLCCNLHCFTHLNNIRLLWQSVCFTVYILLTS